MNWNIATDEQLKVIAFNDNGIPAHLASGVALEMIKRQLWNGIIVYAAKKAYKNVEFVIKQRLLIDWQELIHIGHIEIAKQLERYKPTGRTLKTFLIMCLITMFIKLNRDAMSEKRYSNIGAVDVDNLDEKVQTRLFQSPVNVEKTVINKITLENCWGVLRENEKKAILLDQEGYSQYEIAEMLNVHKRYGNILLKRAYEKLRKQMGA